jgi:hypothetical protein
VAIKHIYCPAWGKSSSERERAGRVRPVSGRDAAHGEAALRVTLDEDGGAGGLYAE